MPRDHRRQEPAHEWAPQQQKQPDCGHTQKVRAVQGEEEVKAQAEKKGE